MKTIKVMTMTNKRLGTWAAVLAFCAFISVAWRTDLIAQVPIIASYLQWDNGPTLSSQGGYLGWNGASLGESDFYNIQGAGVGGYKWFNTSAPTLLMTLSSTGVLTPSGSFAGPLTGNVTGNASGTQLTYSNALINGNGTLTLTGSLGLNLGYNQTLGGGESDFVNQQTGSTGGFAWYNTTTTALGTAIMKLTGAGVLTVNSVVANLTGNVTGNTAGTHTGAVVGNASTSTALAAAPSTCAAGSYASGILASGAPASCPTQVYALKGTVSVAAASFPTSATTFVTSTFTLGATPAAGAVILCTPQSDFGTEVQYTCWATGTTLSVKLTHGTVGLPFTSNAVNLNYVVMQ